MVQFVALVLLLLISTASYNSSEVSPSILACCDQPSNSTCLTTIHQSILQSAANIRVPVTKFTLVSYDTENILQYSAYSFAINALFANIHGHTVFAASESGGFNYEERDQRWNKVKVLEVLVQEMLRTATVTNSSLSDQQYLVWMDSDLVVLDLLLNFEDIVNKHRDADIIVSKDVDPLNGLVNTGCMIVRCSTWSASFLAEWWLAADHVDGMDQHVFDLVYEQRRKHDSSEISTNSVARKIAILPFHALNSHIPASRNQAPSHRFLHLAGESAVLRTHVFKSGFAEICRAASVLGKLDNTNNSKLTTIANTPLTRPPTPTATPQSSVRSNDILNNTNYPWVQQVTPQLGLTREFLSNIDVFTLLKDELRRILNEMENLRCTPVKTNSVESTATNKPCSLLQIEKLRGKLRDTLQSSAYTSNNPIDDLQSLYLKGLHWALSAHLALYEAVLVDYKEAVKIYSATHLLPTNSAKITNSVIGAGIGAEAGIGTRGTSISAGDGAGAGTEPSPSADVRASTSIDTSTSGSRYVSDITGDSESDDRFNKSKNMVIHTLQALLAPTQGLLDAAFELCVYTHDLHRLGATLETVKPAVNTLVKLFSLPSTLAPVLYYQFKYLEFQADYFRQSGKLVQELESLTQAHEVWEKTGTLGFFGSGNKISDRNKESASLLARIAHIQCIDSVHSNDTVGSSQAGLIAIQRSLSQTAHAWLPIDVADLIDAVGGDAVSDMRLLITQLRNGLIGTPLSERIAMLLVRDCYTALQCVSQNSRRTPSSVVHQMHYNNEVQDSSWDGGGGSMCTMLSPKDIQYVHFYASLLRTLCETLREGEQCAPALLSSVKDVEKLISCTNTGKTTIESTGQSTGSANSSSTANTSASATMDKSNEVDPMVREINLVADHRQPQHMMETTELEPEGYAVSPPSVIPATPQQPRQENKVNQQPHQQSHQQQQQQQELQEQRGRVFKRLKRKRK